MKIQGKKIVASAAASLLAVSSLAVVAPAMAEDPQVLDPSVPADAAKILTDFDNITLTKQIHANEAVDTDGIVYNFAFAPAAVAQIDQKDSNGRTLYQDNAVPEQMFVYVDESDPSQGAFLPNTTDPYTIRGNAPVKVTADEEGAFVVPSADWDDNASTADNQNAIPAIQLTADAMSGELQTLSDTLSLPDADKFVHAGVYAFTVSEVSDYSGSNEVASHWTEDESVFKIRLYVINNPYLGKSVGDVVDGHTITAGDDVTSELVYKQVTIEQIGAEADGSAMSEKVDAFDFDNTYSAVTDLEIEKVVSGDFADRTHEFSFNLTVNLPAYVEDGTYSYVDGDGDTQTLTVVDHTATISNFTLSDAENLKITGLPVGTTYSLTETTPVEGVNNYRAALSYFYDGDHDSATRDDQFADKTNAIADGTAGATTTWAYNTGNANTRTALGLGTGNKATVTNTLDNPPSPTGVLVETLPFVLGFAIPAMLAAGVFAIKRKREED